MSIVEALDLEDARVIAVAGAGGKSGLIEALGREFHQSGESVLATTTTRVGADEFQEGWRHVTNAADAKESLAFLSAGLMDDGRKRSGVAPEIVDRLARIGGFQRLLVEADGARRLSLKAPGPKEPVVPDSCDTLIVVMGLSALGCPLGEETVFRAQLWSEITGASPGEAITPLDLWLAVCDLKSYGRAFAAVERRILLLNQQDALENQDVLDEFAKLAAHLQHPFTLVAGGQLHAPPHLVRLWNTP
jgi:probable selenium-dependent hydroxylase accessory protein YqeC